MGKKTYFEFLEEEYQVLASEAQKSLATVMTTKQNNKEEEEQQQQQNNLKYNHSGNDDDNDILQQQQQQLTTTGTQLTRCQAVYQQLRSECRGDDEFKERATLYKIQLEALQFEHERCRSLLVQKQQQLMEETTIYFSSSIHND